MLFFHYINIGPESFKNNKVIYILNAIKTNKHRQNTVY